jgi:hypothetical protein
MILLRCTKRLLKQSGLSADEEPADAPTAPLGEWYANVAYLPFPGRALVVYVHAPSRLTVLVPGRSVRTTRDDFRQRTTTLLDRIGVPQPVIDAQQEAMADVTVLRTNDRSMLGSMNDIVQNVKYRAGQLRRFEAFDLSTVELHLSTMPHSPLDVHCPDRWIDDFVEQWGDREGYVPDRRDA